MVLTDLQLLRAVHSLWSPSVLQSLPGELKAAMAMSEVERTSLLGEGNPRLAKGALAFADGSQADIKKEGYVDPNETDLRNWLKGIRDSGYVRVSFHIHILREFISCICC